MTTLNIEIDDQLNEKFREEVFRRMGMKKGNIKKAIEEAISMWIDFQKKKGVKQQKKARKTRKNR